MTIQRQTRFDTQAVTRRQTTGRCTQFQQTFEHSLSRIGMGEDFVGDALSGVACARDNQIIAIQRDASDACPAQLLQLLPVVFAGVHLQQDVFALRPLQRDIHTPVSTR